MNQDRRWRGETHVIEDRNARLAAWIEETRRAAGIHCSEVQFVGGLHSACDRICGYQKLDDPAFGGDLRATIGRTDGVADSPAGSLSPDEMNRHKRGETRR